MVDLDPILTAVREIGQETIASAARDVDARARFPSEAFEALKGLELLSAYVPSEIGGAGLSMTQICRICEILGQ